jgi:hypothetical protein
VRGGRKGGDVVGFGTGHRVVQDQQAVDAGDDAAANSGHLMAQGGQFAADGLKRI